MIQHDRRPLTPRMISELQKCREMELDPEFGKVCTIDVFGPSFAGLYKRGLINVKKYAVQDKELVGAYLTEKGIELLTYVENTKKADNLCTDRKRADQQ